MTEEEKKAIEDYKRVIAMYFKYSDYDLFCSNLMKSGVKGTIQNTMADMINLIEKLQKENEELKKQKVEYLDKIYNKIDNLKYEYKKAAMHSEPERASFYRDLIRHFKILLEED